MVIVIGNSEFLVECIGKNFYLGEIWVYWLCCSVWEKLLEGFLFRGRIITVYVDDFYVMVIFGGCFWEKGVDLFIIFYILYDEIWWLDLMTDTWIQL